MKYQTCCSVLWIVLSAGALPAVAVAGTLPASLPVAGEQLYALPPDAAVRQVLAAMPQLRVGGLNRDLAGVERARLVDRKSVV